ncbi:MAG: hypothetical protein Q9161_001928 [Pseudevernia consocians]
MFPLSKPLSGVLLTSLFTASIILTPLATTSSNDPNPPVLLLSTANDTTTLPGSEPADTAWYPYASSLSFPTSSITPPPPSDDTIPSLNTSSSLAAAKIVCDGVRYGRNLRIASCLDAYNRMDNSPVPKTYGERNAEAPGSTTWDANLPLRILSSDALCALDISHSAASPSDTITPSLLRTHARSLLAVCVQGSPSLGGIASNLGQAGHLALRVTPYRPRVHCFGPGTGPPWETCRDLVDGMPVGGGRTIDTTSEPDSSDFYKLWAAANAVDTLCVVKGKAGMAIGNGLSGNLVVGLKDLQLEPGMLNASTGGVGELDAMS